MRGIGIGTVFAIIAGIYAIGLIIHFWWIIIAILLAVYGHDMILKSKKRSTRTTTTKRPVRSQAHYSNRR
jgi:hypothetical protein